MSQQLNTLRPVAFVLLGASLLSLVGVWVFHLLIPEELERIVREVPVKIAEFALADAMLFGIGLVVLLYLYLPSRHRLYLWLVYWALGTLPLFYAGFQVAHAEITWNESGFSVSRTSTSISFGEVILVLGFLGFILFAAAKYSALKDDLVSTT